MNIPAESGEMGVLASHVPSIEQLRPGLVEVIEESGGSKQFFCTYTCCVPTQLMQQIIYAYCLKEEHSMCLITSASLMCVLSPVSGGFAIVQPGSQLSINAVEGFPLEDFSPDVSS